jgi:hypothetical protein
VLKIGRNYDANKASGNLRGSLYDLLEVVWPGLNAAVQSPGFYWGDLLYAGQLQPVQGKFVFRPNLVEYRIPINSPLGKQIAGTAGGSCSTSILLQARNSTYTMEWKRISYSTWWCCNYKSNSRK